MKLRMLLLAAMLYCATGFAQIVSLSPTSLNFSNSPVGVISAARNVVLTNTGGSTLAISSISLVGTYGADYSQTNNCGSSVIAGGNCTIAVRFSPGSIGVRPAQLRITDNAAGSPHAVPLTGTGLHDVVLAWAASPTSGVVGYFIYRGVVSGGQSGTPLNGSPNAATSYVDLTVKDGINYFYIVKAVGSDGTTQSVGSNQANARVPQRHPVIIVSR